LGTVLNFTLLLWRRSGEAGDEVPSHKLDVSSTSPHLSHLTLCDRPLSFPVEETGEDDDGLSQQLNVSSQTTARLPGEWGGTFCSKTLISKLRRAGPPLSPAISSLEAATTLRQRPRPLTEACLHACARETAAWLAARSARYPIQHWVLTRR
jgi:hypothetical protein